MAPSPAEGRVAGGGGMTGSKKREHVERKIRDAVLDLDVAVPEQERFGAPVGILAAELVEGGGLPIA